MFRKKLAETFQKIFDLDENKVSFDLSKIKFSDVGYSGEQECLFIEISKSRNNILDGQETAQITGHAKIFINQDRLPYGYFSKKIRNADPMLTNPLFFYEIEDNAQVYGNIVLRSFNFVYFYDNQYDPDLGEITDVNLTTQVT